MRNELPQKDVSSSSIDNVGDHFENSCESSDKSSSAVATSLNNFEKTNCAAVTLKSLFEKEHSYSITPNTLICIACSSKFETENEVIEKCLYCIH